MIKKAEIDDVKDIMYLSSLIKDNKVTETYFLNKIEDDNYLLLIDKKDDKVVGYLLVYHSFSSADIFDIAVDEKYRRRGIASGLINSIKIYLKDVTEINLDVREKNVSAISLYEKLGFSVFANLLAYLTHQNAFGEKVFAVAILLYKNFGFGEFFLNFVVH